MGVTEFQVHQALVMGLLVLSPIVLLSLLFLSAPYGRHARSGWGPTVPARWGWIVMESPSVLLFIGVYFAGEHALATAPLILLALWQIHYINRMLIYPFRLRNQGQRMPLAIAAMAFTFTAINSYINARWLTHFGDYADDWITSPAFLIGVTIFVIGFVINQQADRILLNLRKPGDTGYRIPEGGLYRWVSCPNYLGEILEWIGWAIAAWSMAGLAFAVFTIANLLPRAITHHRWYREQFDRYPPERRALIPGLL